MSDLFDQLPAPPNPPTTAVGGRVRLGARGGRLGRPPGARNRGSMDLGRYIEATFGGMTPGQQAAELGLVKPADVARATKDAERLVQLGLMSAKVLEIGLSKLQLAQAVKAVQLGQAIGCETRDAYLLGQKERAELMKYVHQAQPTAKPKDATVLPTMFVVDREDLEAAQLGAPEADAEILEDFDLPADQVSPPKSHDAG